jgi:hypothetical protein
MTSKKHRNYSIILLSKYFEGLQNKTTLLQYKYTSFRYKHLYYLILAQI